MKTQNIKKGDTCFHQQRGNVLVLSELGGGPNKGTSVKLIATGEEFEASTVYLREIKKNERVVPANPGT